MRPYVFFVSGPKFTKIFSLNVDGAVVDHLLYRFLMSQSVPEIFAIPGGCGLASLSHYLAMPKKSGGSTA